MKFLYIINTIAFSFLMTSNGCERAEYVDNSRIFVEGKIISKNGTSANLPVQLINDDLLVSEGQSKSDGTFRLGGAATTLVTSLFVNKKIESFSANTNGCTLNYDSLSINLPADRKYVKFDSIILQE